MAKKLIGLVAGIAVIGGSAKLFAQEGAKRTSKRKAGRSKAAI
jgi:hypothetical protein